MHNPNSVTSMVAMMHFPLFQISPYFRTSFTVRFRFCHQFYLFLKQFQFSPPTFLITFLVTHSKFLTSLCFHKMYTFLPISEKLLSPYFYNFPLFSFDFLFLLDLRVFCFPIF